MITNIVFRPVLEPRFQYLVCEKKKVLQKRMEVKIFFLLCFIVNFIVITLFEIRFRT